MNILMLVYNMRGVGTYWRAFYLARELVKSGDKVTIVLTSQNKRMSLYTWEEPITGILHIETPDLLGGPLRSGWDLWNTLIRIIKTHNRYFDIVHAFESRPVVIFPGLYWKYIKQKRLFIDWCDWLGRGGLVEERTNPIVRAILRPIETFFEESFRTRANGNTVINAFLKSKAIEIGLNSETIMILPNGCNIEEIYPIPKFEARKVLGLPTDEVFLIGYSGSIFNNDAKLMVEAFNRLSKINPRVNLLLIGYSNFRIKHMVHRQEAVLQTGRLSIEELNLYLSACDLFWLPLRRSGANIGRSPLKIKDFMAAGRPVIATNVGEVGELVQKGGFGLVVEDNPDSLVNTTLEVIGDEAKLDIMGQRGRELAETEYRWAWITDKLRNFYISFLGS